jgi:hypothetical protein
MLISLSLKMPIREMIKMIP